MRSQGLEVRVLLLAVVREWQDKTSLETITAKGLFIGSLLGLNDLNDLSSQWA